MTEDTRKQTTVRIEESLLKAIKVEDATGSERLSLTDAIDTGIRLVLAQRRGEVPAPPSPPPSIADGLLKADRDLLVRLADFLRSDHPSRSDVRKVMSDMLNLFTARRT